MTREDINKILDEPRAQSIINEPDFYFQKAQDALRKWLDKEVHEDLKNELLRLSKDYDEFQDAAKGSGTIKEILDLLFEIISYCDTKAKDKNIYNKYDDKRCLAMASVRMNSWIEHLILFKFSPDNLKKGSTKNAFKYLLDPGNNATILSENHRTLVSQNLLKKGFNSDEFVNDLKAYYGEFNLTTTNPDNYTQLLSRIIYSTQNEWKEEVIALMASDSTGWHDDRIEEMEEVDATVIWNSKRPSGTNQTLKFLRNIIEEGEAFNLYYSAGGMVNYKASIIDFAENQKELTAKEWNRKYNVLYFNENFSAYKDDRKSAAIIFLAKSLEKIKPISVDEFEFFNGYDVPRQDNLSPVKSEPDEIEIEKNTVLTKKNEINNADFPLNQILFGPPGTGKTYNAINRAISIINTSFDITKPRGEVKAEFDRLRKEGQIVFTTFHQSMSYEDFIEGIKPTEPSQDGHSVNYEVVPGIFMEISKKAKENNDLTLLKNAPNARIPFEAAFDQLNQEIENAVFDDTMTAPKGMKKGLVIRLATSLFTITAIKGSSIKMMTITGNEQNTMTKPTLEKIFEDPDNIEKYVSGGMKTYYRALVEEMFKWQGDIKKLSQDLTAKKYVLIIDEINRGNVSQIFGELITLIEEDKRLGNDEALDATLTYSKEKFGVPPNLYIVGTMNTADRSVEALDAALRRRFSFEEMPPKYELEQLKYKYAGIPVYSILETINKRIEKLLDKDHAIGHSYFILKKQDDPGSKVPMAFYRNIIPLLQEYFFGDYAKIGLVLGKGFIRSKKWHDDSDPFADFDAENSNDFGGRDIFEIIDYTKDVVDYQIEINKRKVVMDFDKAIKLLMKQDIE